MLLLDFIRFPVFQFICSVVQLNHFGHGVDDGWLISKEIIDMCHLLDGLLSTLLQRNVFTVVLAFL
jgi:hypothetical protein